MEQPRIHVVSLGMRSDRVTDKETLIRHVTGFSHMRNLSTPAQKDLIERACAFLARPVFLGVEGLKVSHLHRSLVAIAAARMTRALSHDAFSALRLIVFYPDGVPQREGGDDGARAAGRTVLRPNGHVHVELCFWEALKGAATPDDGIDVVVHELAHVLDLTDGGFDGKPALHAGQDEALWEGVRDNHLALVRQEDLRVSGVLRPYAGTNEAELFAVASETFFERPVLLQSTLPSLYRKLERFYGPP